MSSTANSTKADNNDGVWPSNYSPPQLNGVRITGELVTSLLDYISAIRQVGPQNSTTRDYLIHCRDFLVTDPQHDCHIDRNFPRPPALKNNDTTVDLSGYPLRIAALLGQCCRSADTYKPGCRACEDGTTNGPFTRCRVPSDGSGSSLWDSGSCANCYWDTEVGYWSSCENAYIPESDSEDDED